MRSPATRDARFLSRAASSTTVANPIRPSSPLHNIRVLGVPVCSHHLGLQWFVDFFFRSCSGKDACKFSLGMDPSSAITTRGEGERPAMAAVRSTLGAGDRCQRHGAALLFVKVRPQQAGACPHAWVTNPPYHKRPRPAAPWTRGPNTSLHHAQPPLHPSAGPRMRGGWIPRCRVAVLQSCWEEEEEEEDGICRYETLPTIMDSSDWQRWVLGCSTDPYKITGCMYEYLSGLLNLFTEARHVYICQNVSHMFE